MSEKLRIANNVIGASETHYWVRAKLVLCGVPLAANVADFILDAALEKAHALSTASQPQPERLSVVDE